MPKSANTVEEITSSRGKNARRRMERLAESAERVITLLESVSSVDEGKNGSTQSQFLPVTLVNHCLFTGQLTPEVHSVHAIQSNIPSKIIAAMKVKAGPETNFQIDTGATCDVLKLSSIKGTKYANKITPTNQVLKMYNPSMLRPLSKCKVQLMNSRDKKSTKLTLPLLRMNTVSI